MQSNRNEIKKVESLLLKLNEIYKIDTERFINFNIAVSEALINAIMHGNKESADKKVFVEINENENSLEVIVKDEGKGFNLDNIPDPTDTGNLHKEHGRGVYIMKLLTDGYDCTFDNSGTKVRLNILINK